MSPDFLDILPYAIFPMGDCVLCVLMRKSGGSAKSAVSSADPPERGRKSTIGNVPLR
jgi:hypothetical protein